MHSINDAGLLFVGLATLGMVAHQILGDGELAGVFSTDEAGVGSRAPNLLVPQLYPFTRLQILQRFGLLVEDSSGSGEQKALWQPSP